LVQHALGKKNGKVIDIHDESIHGLIPLTVFELVDKAREDRPNELHPQCYFVAIALGSDSILYEKHNHVEQG